MMKPPLFCYFAFYHTLQYHKNGQEQQVEQCTDGICRDRIKSTGYIVLSLPGNLVDRDDGKKCRILYGYDELVKKAGGMIICSRI